MVHIVRDCLSDDLRRAKYRGSPNKYKGHCYVACEALYHLWGKEAGYKPCVVRVSSEETHWFLKNKETGEIIDPTEDQFDFDISALYKEGKFCGFLTKYPSKRAQILIDRVLDYEVRL